VVDRKKTLKSIEKFVKEYECSATKGINELVAREMDMLKRGGASTPGLSGLRQRLFNLFIQYVEQFSASFQSSK